MTKTIQKNMLLVGGLLFLAQTALVPVASASAYIEKQTTYAHAATSADPIIFDHRPTFGENAIKVIESVNHALTLNMLDSQADESVIAKVEADPEPTIESIKAYVFAEAKKAGLNANEVAAIVNCESKWDAKAYNDKNRNGSIDMGLWQINSIHKNITNADKMDYKASTKWAITKRLADGNWSAWSCSRRIAKTKPAKELAVAPAVNLDW